MITKLTFVVVVFFLASDNYYRITLHSRDTSGFFSFFSTVLNKIKITLTGSKGQVRTDHVRWENTAYSEEYIASLVRDVSYHKKREIMKMMSPMMSLERLHHWGVEKKWKLKMKVKLFWRCIRFAFYTQCITSQSVQSTTIVTWTRYFFQMVMF